MVSKKKLRYNILDFFSKCEELSKNNMEFQNELAEFPEPHYVQILVEEPKSKINISFGEGKFIYNSRLEQSPDLTIEGSHEKIWGIVNNKLNAANEWEKGNLEIIGDMQYGVIFFDFLQLAYEILGEVEKETLNNSFIWGHRGAGFRGVMNTIPSFKQALSMGVDGIKSEGQLSKEGQVILTFKSSLPINGTSTPINELTIPEIKQFKLKNNLTIPTLREVFETFKKNDIRYNFDIKDPKVGIKIVKTAKEYNILNKIELSKPSTYKGNLSDIFSEVRDYEKEVTLSNSISLLHYPIKIKHLEVNEMKNLAIEIVNANYIYANYELFRKVKDLGFKFYVWGLLFKRNMIEFLKMKYKGEYIDGMFSNLPDKLVKLRDKIQN
jgi:glycerophosphoryl diester phosphodiesterase